ncbi:hypothetical protein ABXS75_06175 [Roseburia hominis]
MEENQSALTIITYKDRMTRHYHGLSKNNEKEILQFLYKNGIQFGKIHMQESHDIGDTDYYTGHIDGYENLMQSKAFEHLYGEWTIIASYNDVEIVIDKQYPNICHGISFRYQKSEDGRLAPIFKKFEKKFCYKDIRFWREDR